MNWEMMWSYSLLMVMDQAFLGVVHSRDFIQLWILESPVGNIYVRALTPLFGNFGPKFG